MKKVPIETRINAQDKKIAAIVNVQKDLCAAVQDLVRVWNIRDMEHKVDAMENRKVIIRTNCGKIVDVLGLPENWEVIVEDLDMMEDELDSIQGLDEEFSNIEDMDEFTDEEFDELDENSDAIPIDKYEEYLDSCNNKPWRVQ